MIFSIQDKVTIITGGSSGIGAAAARRFVNAGANVCIASRRDSSAFADEIGAISIMCDVAKESDVRRLIEQVVNRFGRIDVLINNAGIWGRTAPILERTAEEMQQSSGATTLGDRKS